MSSKKVFKPAGALRVYSRTQDSKIWQRLPVEFDSLVTDSYPNCVQIASEIASSLASSKEMKMGVVVKVLYFIGKGAIKEGIATVPDLTFIAQEL